MEESRDATVEEIGRAAAPWGKELVVQALLYSSGLRMARIRIREGRRFTIVDLDDKTAQWLADALEAALGDPLLPPPAP